MAPSGYAKKMSVEIAPSSAGAESNYPVKVTLVKGSGTNSKGVGYLDNQSLNWPNDIRWADNSGNELSFWREESDDTDGTWWIKVTSIPTGSNTTIWVYFGKSGNSDASSGANTAVLFDDFNGESIDSEKWDTLTINNATINLVSGSAEVKVKGTTGSGAGLISKNAVSSRSYAIEARIKRQGSGGGGELGALVGVTDKTTRDTTYYGHYSLQSLWFAVWKYTANNQLFRIYGASQDARGSTSWASYDNVWVRAKTDNLPADPADESSLEAAITAAHATTDALISAITGGGGLIEKTYTLHDASTGLPLVGVQVWATTDEAGEHQVDITRITNDAGQVTFRLNLEAGTPVYIWHRYMADGDAPDEEVV